MSQTGKKIITIHTLPNISKSKSNQTIKFGQLIEYNTRNIFLHKSCRKCGEETNPSFNINSLKLYTVFFIVCPCRGPLKYIETKMQITCLYLIENFLKKQIEVLNQSPCLIFFLVFVEKYFSHYILLTDQTSLSNCHYFVRCWIIREF